MGNKKTMIENKEIMVMYKRIMIGEWIGNEEDNGEEYQDNDRELGQ